MMMTRRASGTCFATHMKPSRSPRAASGPIWIRRVCSSYSLVRLLEIVGEAAACVSLETRGLHASIPWRQVVSMRNRLVHGYDEVDLDILWDTVTRDIPHLITELEQALALE